MAESETPTNVLPAAAVPAETPQEEKPASSSPWTTAFGLLVYGAVILGVLWNSAIGKRYSQERWWVALGLAVAILAILVVPASRRRLARSTAQGRIGFVVFGVVPVVLLLVGAIVLLDAPYQLVVIRAVFLTVVCSFPAVLYYLFISTKKYSLLNEFIIHLDRLGLRDPRQLPKDWVPPGLANETEEERKNRVYTYVQKFEAVYGAIPTDLGGLVLDPTNTGQRTMDVRLSKTGSSGLGGLFTMDTTVPVLIATLLIALGWMTTLPPWEGQLVLPWIAAATPQTAPAPAPPSAGAAWVDTLVATPVQFAFLGAYFFSLQMLFRRYVRRDLRASAYVSVSLRIILSVIGTWAVLATLAVTGAPFRLDARQLVVMGFIIGVFPRVVWQVLQAFAKRVTGAALVLPSLHAQLPISDLDGLTVWHEARLEEEDVENIPNMATADLIDMIINTRFPADRIVDWVDQAILYTHLGPEKSRNGVPTRREVLRGHGIRTASALVDAYQRSEARGDLASFEALLPADGGGRSPVRTLVDTVCTNPNLRLIQIWRGLYLEPHAKPA